MFKLKTFYIIQVLTICLNFVSGLCPHAYQNYNLLKDNIRTTYDSNKSPLSYDTYETVCHRYVPQPPSISDTIIDNAMRKAVDRTKRYISLDNAAGTSARKLLTDIDRNNYYFESATKYVQETTCSSKSTTIEYLPTFALDKNYLTDNVTRITCDNGHLKYPNCASKSLYRKIDGTCNNLKRPLEGRPGDCMLRLLQPDYKDGVSQLRTSIDGTPLPNARIVSTNLLGQDDNRPMSNRFSQFHAFFGEFVIADNGMTLRHDTGMLVNLQCCDSEQRPRIDHPQCAAFFITPKDDLRQKYPNQTCMQFPRSLPCARCRLGPRFLASSASAAQDLHSVYGLSSAMLNSRRTMVGGLLKSQLINGHELFAVERFNTSGRFRCFEGKCERSPVDGRNLNLPTGQAFALLFHRNHNRHARILSKIKPNWNDEQVFQEARRWNIAEYQHCVYNEYLETLIGRKLGEYFGILPKPVGQFSTYKPAAQLKTVIEFQTTAGRHGHAALTEDIFIIDLKSNREFVINFRQSELHQSIFYDGHVDGMFLAQMTKPAFDTTPSIPFKTFLYDLPGRTFGLDLAALDIQRQRDHGIPGYIQYLKYFHNVEVQSWEDLLQFIHSEDINKLREHYKYVEDVELYVGGHYERKIPNGLVGQTFATIIATQFHNVKYGDRFFYEHGNQVSSFSIEQLNEIKTKTSFASILCRNTVLDQMLPDPLRVRSYTNQFVPCTAFADIDYKL